MFHYETIGQKSIITWALRSGKLMGKATYESVKQNKRIMAKSKPSHTENRNTHLISISASHHF